MKTVRKSNILVCLLAFFMFCIIGAAFHTATSRQASAEGSYTLTFEDKRVPTKSLNEYFGVPVDSATTPTSEKYGENGVKITFNGAGKATINLGKELGLEANKTYVQTFKVKLDTVSTESLFYLHPYALHFNDTEKPGAQTALAPVYKEATSKWEANWFHYNYYKNEKTWTNTFTYDGTANNGNFVLYFNAQSGRAGSIYIWDLTLTEVQSKTIENGAAIGTLPEVPAKEGYTGYWTIDDEKITAETVYNYGADKTAIAKYVQEYTLTFEDKRVPSKSLDQYFMNGETSATAEAYGENGAAITFTSSTDKAIINIGAEMGLTTGKSYIQSFKIRLEKPAGAAGNLAVHPYGLHLNYTERANNKNHLYFVNGKPMWLTSAPDSFGSEKTLTNKFTYDGTNNGSFVLQFNGNANSGTLYIWDLTLTEVQSKTVENGTAIGTLPEVPAKEGYQGYWAIDGEKITAETVYNYGANKTAVKVYEPRVYTVTFDSGIPAQNVAYGEKATQPATPEKAATADYTYSFAGWYNGENQWDFENDVVTGNVSLTAKFNEVDRVGTIKTMEVLLNGKITVRFGVYVTPSALTEDSASLSVTVGEQTVSMPVSAAEKNESGYYMFEVSVAAAQMTESIYLQVVSSSGSGVKVWYTVRQYADYMLTASAGNEAKIALIKAMLDYGAYAQVLFGVNTDNLANSGIHEGENPVTAVTSIEADTTTTGSATGATLTEFDLLLQTDCTLRLVYTLGNAADYTATLKYNDGTEKTFALEIVIGEAENQYYIDIPHIPAPMIDTVYSVTIKHVDGTTATTNISALSYAAAVLNSETATENQKNAVKALYLYNVAANEYFNK